MLVKTAPADKVSHLGENKEASLEDESLKEVSVCLVDCMKMPAALIIPIKQEQLEGDSLLHMDHLTQQEAPDPSAPKEEREEEQILSTGVHVEGDELPVYSPKRIKMSPTPEAGQDHEVLYTRCHVDDGRWGELPVYSPKRIKMSPAPEAGQDHEVLYTSGCAEDDGCWGESPVYSPKRINMSPAPEAGQDHEGTMAEGGEEMDLVADLLAKPFFIRTFQEKLEIVRKGRPTPQLAALTQASKGCVRHFQSSNYKRYTWLTASKEHCKLYCWECLLFANERYGAWSHFGFANLSCLTKSATKHQSTVAHLQAIVQSKTLDTRVDLQLNEQTRQEVELHNEKVKKNREILKRLIDCIIFQSKQELSFRGDDESKESTNGANHVELISFLAEYDKDLHYHLSTNKVFTGTLGKIQNDLITVIAEVMAEEVKREVKKAPFVTVMVDEATDVCTAAQLALVLRYVTDTGVKERFVRFEDVTSARRADDIAALVIRFLEEHECLDKVVVQCFDGAAVTASGLNGVQAKVKVKAPMALFIHCYAHRLNVVLTHGASKLRECRVFFAHLNCLAAFFSRSRKCARLLDDICQRHLPGVAPTRWLLLCSSRLVSTVFEKRVSLMELFEHVLERHDEYDEDSVRCADGYNAHLGDFEFRFLLSTFHAIFERSNALLGTLKNKTFDMPFWLARMEEFCDTVEGERGRFDEVYESTARDTGVPSARRGQAQEDVRARYQKLHSDILYNIIAQIQSRFKDHEKVVFLSLLDPQQFHTYRKKFPDAAFSSLAQSHGTLFDLSRLKTELTVTYAMHNFVGKRPAALLAFLQQKDLCGSMCQLYTLACLAVTIPVCSASLQRTWSALKRIRTYSRNKTGRDRSSALASMAIEHDLLSELKRTDVLYDRVIELFIKKERRVDFVFK